MVYFVLSSVNFATVYANLNSIPVLNGTNFKDWKDNVLIVLGYMDLDLALRVEQLPSPTNSSSSKENTFYEKWERLNRMSLMIIKSGIPETFKGVVSEGVTNVKQFLLSRFKCTLSKEIRRKKNMLFLSLTSMRFNDKGIHKGVHYGNISNYFKNQNPKDPCIKRYTHTFDLELSSCII